MKDRSQKGVNNARLSTVTCQPVVVGLFVVLGSVVGSITVVVGSMAVVVGSMTVVVGSSVEVL